MRPPEDMLKIALQVAKKAMKDAANKNDKDVASAIKKEFPEALKEAAAAARKAEALAAAPSATDGTSGAALPPAAASAAAAAANSPNANASWHVIVGKNYAVSVTNATRYLAFFSLDETNILLFKSNFNKKFIIQQRHYGSKVIDHFENPKNVGSFDKNDPNVGTAVVGKPSCGDVLKLQFKVNDEGLITDACFKTFGCGSAIAASSLATEWSKGKTIDEVLEIKNQDIAKHLSLPPVKLHCSMLAEEAIRSVVKDIKKKREAKKEVMIEKP